MYQSISRAVVVRPPTTAYMVSSTRHHSQIYLPHLSYRRTRYKYITLRNYPFVKVDFTFYSYYIIIIFVYHRRHLYVPSEITILQPYAYAFGRGKGTVFSITLRSGGKDIDPDNALRPVLSSNSLNITTYFFLLQLLKLNHNNI